MNRKNHTVSGAFVFLLLGVFAVFSTVLVLLGAQLYRDIADESERHNQRRVLGNYLVNTVRGNDTLNSVSLPVVDGVQTLALTWAEDGEGYVTYIYCHEGALRELFISTNETFEIGYGERICAAESFEASLDGQNLNMRVINGWGEEQTLTVALRSSQEGAL